MKIVLINMVTILIMSAKMAVPGLLKIKEFWNRGYDAIIFGHNVTNKILSRDSNNVVDVVMWPKFGNFTTSMREVIITSFYKDLTRKNCFFKGWSWFKFNNLGLALGTNLKSYTSVAKALKLKVRMFFGLIPTFVEVAGEKLVRGPFCTPPILDGFKRISVLADGKYLLK